MGGLIGVMGRERRLREKIVVVVGRCSSGSLFLLTRWSRRRDVRGWSGGLVVGGNLWVGSI
jgi:hypothetical protein